MNRKLQYLIGGVGGYERAPVIGMVQIRLANQNARFTHQWKGNELVSMADESKHASHDDGDEYFRYVQDGLRFLPYGIDDASIRIENIGEDLEEIVVIPATEEEFGGDHLAKFTPVSDSEGCVTLWIRVPYDLEKERVVHRTVLLIDDEVKKAYERFLISQLFEKSKHWLGKEIVPKGSIPSRR